LLFSSNKGDGGKYKQKSGGDERGGSRRGSKLNRLYIITKRVQANKTTIGTIQNNKLIKRRKIRSRCGNDPKKNVKNVKNSRKSQQKQTNETR